MGSQPPSPPPPPPPPPPFPWKKVIVALGSVCAVLALILGARFLISDDPVPPAETISMATEAASAPAQRLSAQMPDFLAFADGQVQENTVENLDTRYSYCYTANQDVRSVFDEYRSLLTSQYPYEEITTTTLVNDWAAEYYWYRYIGTDPVTDLSITVDEAQGPIEGYNAWSVYLVNQNCGNVCLYAGAANEIAYVDNGDRTSVTPDPGSTEPIATNPGGGMQLSGLTINCYDLLCDPGTLSPAGWVPVGYEIGYDLSVEYLGQKDGDFAATVTSSDESVLRVDAEKFRIYAIAPGTATITATLGDQSSSQQISVYPVDSSTGSSLQISTPVIEVSGTEQVKVPVTITMTFGPSVQVMNTRFLVDKGVVSHDGSGEWTKVADRTYSREVVFTIDPQQVSNKTDNGILFYMMCKDGDDSYELERDILDYTVVQIVEK